ncbi:MAG: serine/threonine protein kinase [Myxococcaceae bacterium]|nr:serine/threonine protein kinase [Myxococcaceae bacterium]
MAEAPSPSLASTLPSGGETAAAPPVTKRYEVRRELARGGQSIVWVAYDRELGREVAFKMPHRGADGSVGANAEARFLREARITARLDHPNIIAVHEIGRTDGGELFCAQRLVRGDDGGQVGTLGQAMAAASTLAERLALLPRMLEVCNAIAFAHGRGVVHRDLKPDNVVLGRQGETVVLDWGLARVLAETDDVSAPGGSALQTQDGQIFGTPLYMSPEQARGERDRVGPRSDVWSLGVMLYELLSGRTPFAGGGLHEVLLKVQQAPVPRLGGEVPPALAAVVARALARSERERYGDARELAAELRAFLDGRTVGAYDYSALELVKLFVSRNRTATLVGAISLVVLVVAVVALARAVRQNRESLAEAFVEKGRGAEALLRWEEAAVWYAAARESADREDATAGLRIVWPRAKEPGRLLPGHSGAVRALLSSPDGRTLFSGSADGTVRVWNLETGREQRVLSGHSQSVNALAISPDGRLLFSGGEDDTVRVWDLTTSEGRVIDRRPDAVNALSVSPTADTLVIGCEDGTVLLLELSSNLVTPFGRHQRPVYAVAFSPDGRLVASGAWDGSLEVRARSDASLVAALKGHSGSVLSLAFSPSGALLASAGRDTTIRLWSTTTWVEKQALLGNTQKTYAIAWAADESMLASAGADGTSRVWAGPSLLPFVSGSLGRDDELLATTFVSGTRVLATAGRRGLISLRNIGSVRTVLDNRHEVLALTELDDGRIALQHNAGFALVAPTLAQATVIVPGPGDDPGALGTPARGAVLSPDGRLALGSGSDRAVRFFSVPDRRSLAHLEAHTDQVEAVALSPDGRNAVSVGRDGRLFVWKTDPPALERELPRSSDGLFSVVFSPDGKLLATAGYDRRVRLYDTTQWKEVRTLEGHEHGVRAVAFSPDGALLASGGWDRSVRLWRVADGSPIATLFGHQDQVTALGFSFDGRRLASGSHDGSIRLWDVARRVEVVRVMVDEGRVNQLLLSRDGRRLFYVRQELHRIDLVDENLPATLPEVLAATHLTMDGLRLRWDPVARRTGD